MMWTSHYDIIVETLTGSEFEITVTDRDTIGYIKSRIQKDEGIPISQQHLLYNHKELSDTVELKDVPLGRGSRLKLVLDLKGGPVSARRVVTVPDFDTTWFDLSEVLNTSRQDPVAITTPGVKLLVYKDCKKNFQRVRKFHADRKSVGGGENTASDPFVDIDRQFLKDNLNTMEKMYQLRTQLESKKKGKSVRLQKSNKLDQTTASIDKTNSKLTVETPSPSNGNNASTLTKDADLMKRTLMKTYESTRKCNSATNNFLRQLHFPSLNNSNNKNSVAAPPPPPIPNTPKLSTSKYYISNTEFTKKYNQNGLRGPPAVPASEVSTRHYNGRTCIRSPLFVPTTKQPTDLRNSMLPTNAKLPIIDRRTQPPFMVNDNESNKVKPSNAFIKSSVPILTSVPFTSDAYRIKVRDNICRNRSFKGINAIGTTVDKNNVCVFKRDSQRLTQRTGSPKNSQASFDQYPINSDAAASTAAAGATANPCRSAPGSAVSDSNLYHVYKMASDAENYDFPKLLIKEGSPLESFHSADAQCETLTILDSSLQADPLLMSSSPPNPTVNPSTNDSRITPPHMNILDPTARWGHHHSELDLKNLKLTFFNDDLENYATDNYLKKNMNVLKIASNLEINNWNPNSPSGGVYKTGDMPHSTTSLNLLNNDIGCSDTAENFSTSCELLQKSSKNSVTKLNEFGMLFGSSPTVLNNKYAVLKTPRLNAIPIQYRRGYSNLNNACLSNSNSASDLDGMQMAHYGRGVSGGFLGDMNAIGGIGSMGCMGSMNSMGSIGSVGSMGSMGSVGNIFPNLNNGVYCGDGRKTAKDNSLLRYKRSGSVDYGRNYENFDMNKNGARMKNKKRGLINNRYCDQNTYNRQAARDREMVSTKNYWYPHCSDYTTQKLIPPPSSSSQEDSGDEYNYAAINNTYDTNTEYLTSESQSNESLFNINFDAIDDEVLELDAISLFEESLSASTNDLLLENKVESAEVKVGHAQSIQVASSGNSAANDIDINRAKMKEIHICTSDGETVSAAAAIQLPDIKPQRAISVACNSSIHLDGVEKMTSNSITTETTTTTTTIRTSATTTSRALVKTNDNNKSISINQIESNITCVPEKPKKLRCAECNKKLGVIMVMKCHCDKLFCAQHRYAEAHSCTYDYKSEGQKTIARENPVVVAQKLQKF